MNIQDEVAGLVGELCQKAMLSWVTNMTTLSFRAAHRYPQGHVDKADETYHLWVYAGDVALSSELANLDQTVVEKVQVDEVSGTLRLEFAGGEWFEASVDDSDPELAEMDQWILFRPDGTVVVCNGDRSFTITASSEPR